MKKLFSQDLSKRAFLLCILALVAAKLFLTSGQLLLLTPYGAPLDDTLMYDTARSVVNGEWFGAYNYLTLSKFMFFPVWLAFLRIINVPYLLGGQLLYTLAALVGMSAFAPVLKKNAAKLALFAILLFNPAQVAAEVQLRVYRDNITPALTLLLFAGFIGFALRWRLPIRKSFGFLLAGGFGLAASYLNREDGVWMLTFAMAAIVITTVFILLDAEKKIKHKIAKIATSLVPFGILAAGILLFCAMNNAVYGRFILSDFSTGEFAAAYGAMARIEQKNPQDKVPVPRDVRLQLYELVPELKELEPYLEADAFYNGYGDVANKEYGGGGFYWALRRAAELAGKYDTPQTSQQYWQTVAQKINALCEDGTLKAGPKNTSTMPILKAHHLLPIIGEGFADLARSLVFSEANPAHTTLSLEMTSVAELREEYETFLGNRCNWMAVENSDKPYYSPLRLAKDAGLTAILWIYRIALPLAFCVAMWWFVRVTPRIFGAWRKKECHEDALLWLIQLGLLLCVLLRCMMIAYLFVASFNNVTHIMYLASVHPLLLMFAGVGCVKLLAMHTKTKTQIEKELVSANA